MANNRTFNKERQSAYLKGGGRPLYSYNPIDIEEDIAIGVMLPFNGANNAVAEFKPTDAYESVSGSAATTVNASAKKIPGKFPLSYTTEEQALSNLKNLLLTYPGERYMQPTFGVRIKDRVFEPNSPELVVKLNKEIQDAISYWLPYIKVSAINIDNKEKDGLIQNTLFIKLTFRVTEQGAEQAITLVSNGDSTTTVDASTMAGAY
tara:strand:+ start:2246 stop:2863 length:618 start_codon:yes stop_codon:yes gene_type:complete